MILRFKVGNFRSIKDVQEISFIADPEDLGALGDNYFTYREGDQTIHLKKTIAIYGANASGKSNVVKALNVFQNLVANSTKFDISNSIKDYVPFLLDDDSVEQPTFFELSFVYNDESFRYGVKFNSDKIIEEYLYKNILSNIESQSLIFRRINQDFELSSSDEYTHEIENYGLILSKMISPKELLLSREARNEHVFLGGIRKYFLIKIHTFEHKMNPEKLTALICHENDKNKQLTRKLLYLTDFHITDFSVKKDEEIQAKIRFSDSVPEELKELILERESLKVETKHQYLKPDGSIASRTFDIKEESDGTQRFFDLAGVFLTALINREAVIFDELNNSFHPAMTRFIIDLFHHPESNPNNAQLLFTTHDTEFIDLDIFNPDQIYFVEKDRKTQASVLYSLADFELPKGKTKFEDWYLADRFGATPAITLFRLPDEYIKNKNHATTDERD